MNIRVKLTKSANYNHYNVSSGSVIQLDLEEYLRGVVPSECYTTWSQNTLKAQAVAARSYAIIMMNRASGNYHVDDTTDYQSFNITNKTTSTTQAVDATAGIVLKYGNRVAETVYCASNGGRCYSAAEVGWYSTPYLVSKNDPWTAATGKSKDGHGVGLSQWGAYYAGSIGTSYQEILNFYFPGTTMTTNYGNGGSPDSGTSNVGKTGTVVVNSAGLNVRSSPNGDPLSYKLYNGERITVLEEETAGGYNWFRVQDEQGRTNGWVRSDFITLDEGGSPDPGTGNVGKTGTVVVNSAGLNVRSSPNGALLSYKLYNGERITVLEEETAGGYNWFRVQDEQGRTNGWVRSDFITLDEGGSPDPGTGNVGKTGTVVVNSAGLNVRSSPNGALLSYKLYNGERITVLEEETAGGYNWFRVQDEQGRTNGWVRSDFITLDEGGGSSGYATWQEKYGDNTFVTSNTYSGNVYRFQVDLNKWRAANGYVAIDADGLWGSASAAATKVFQQAFSDLDADGLCGPATKAKLFSLYG